MKTIRFSIHLSVVVFLIVLTVQPQKELLRVERGGTTIDVRFPDEVEPLIFRMDAAAKKMVAIVKGPYNTDRSALLVDLDDRQSMRTIWNTLQTPGRYLSEVAFTEDEEMLWVRFYPNDGRRAGGHIDQLLNLRNLLLSPVPNHVEPFMYTGCLRSVVSKPDIAVFDEQGPAIIRHFNGCAGSISPNGRFVAIADYHGKITIYSCETHQPVQQITFGKYPDSSIVHMGNSPDKIAYLAPDRSQDG